MKILITHFYSQKNNGDAAILSIMLKELRQCFPDSSFLIATANKTIEGEAFEGIPFRRSFFYYAIYKSKNSLLRLLRVLHVLFLATLWAILYRATKIEINFLLSADIKNMLEAYIQSDLVIPCGGGYLLDIGGVHGFVTFLLQFHTLLIAFILDKPVILFSQSIGPFKGFFQTFIARTLLNKTEAILVRESLSLETLRLLGISHPIIDQISDAAFSLVTTQTEQMRKFLLLKGIDFNKGLVGLTLRRFYNKNLHDLYVTSVIELIEYITVNKRMQVVIIPQVTDFFHNDDDREIAQEVVNKMKNSEKVFNLKNEFDFYSIKAIYENLDYLIGTRLHSVIFALTGSIPSIGIAYERKTVGILQDLGLIDWVVAEKDINGAYLINMFDRLVREQSKYKDILRKQIPVNQEKSQQRIMFVKQVVKKIIL